MALCVASFFAGIGGFDLGFERAGFEVVFHCEIDNHCQRILKKHWPGVPLHGDITSLRATDIPTADVWCAGWPCQDLSNANSQRAGLSGARSGLFHTFVELAKARQPAWIVLENVPGILSADKGTALETVIDRLEEIGYMGGWFSANTADAGLPHNRERVFFVGSLRPGRAYQFFVDGSELSRDFATGKSRAQKAGQAFRNGTKSQHPLVVQRRGGFGYTMAKSISPTIRAQTGGHQGGHSDRPILCGQELDVERVRETNGISGRLDGRRGRLIGNAVSPVIVEWLAHRLLACEYA